MKQILYASAVVALAVVPSPTQAWEQPIVCVPPPNDPCDGKLDCVTVRDEWQVTVEPSGQVNLSGNKVSRKELNEYAASWAKQGTFPIVVSGQPGTKYAQVTSIVAELRKAGVFTRIVCIVPPH